MEKYKIITLFVLSALTACTLKEDPKSMVSQGDVYKTEESLEACIFGCYRGMLGGQMITGEMNEYLHPASGLTTWQASSFALTDASELTASMREHLTQYSTNSTAYTEFKGFYSAISYANTLLKNLPDSPVDEGFKNEIAAEAHFVRGLCYYYLVRQWGSVPLYLEPVSSLEEASIGRTPFEEIYKQVIDDLNIAWEGMREIDRVNQVSGAFCGRPCRWAAKAFLSEVYLYIGTLMAHPDDNYWNTSKRTPDWAKCYVQTAEDAFTLAMNYADDVIENGPYALAYKYTDLFDWGNPAVYSSKERILAMTNTNSTSTGNFCCIRTMPEFPEGTSNYSTANRQYGRWRPDRWMFQQWGMIQGGTLGTQQVDNEVFVTVEDPRLDQTIWHTKYYNLNTKVTIDLYPAEKWCWDCSGVHDLYFKKYLDPAYDVTSGNADFYVMRLAEMYLNSAEAAANLSAAPGDQMWQKAFDRVEAIHARARRSVPDGTPEKYYPAWEANRFTAAEFTPEWNTEAMAEAGIAFDSHEALISGIFWERMFEMLGEGHEFYDTHRMGATWLRNNIVIPKNFFFRRREQQMAYDFWRGLEEKNESYCVKFFGRNDFQITTDVQELRKSLLSAFPKDEFTYNTSISFEKDQNDFYWK